MATVIRRNRRKNGSAIRQAHLTASEAPPAGMPSRLIDIDFDLLCFSHLRWNFVFQRPHHLMTRFARKRRVFYIEEPVFSPEVKRSGEWSIAEPKPRLRVATPVLQEGTPAQEVDGLLETLVERLRREHEIQSYVCWYYTPMALTFTRQLRPMGVVYDCMDELKAFRGAPTALGRREAELFRRAHVVFTGGQSLYECKRDLHPNVHAMPSSVDVDHFARARETLEDPPDQAPIPHPRFGFFGVIDERFDRELLDGAAAARPDWHFVMIGPTAKIDPAVLPRRPNIHYLGGKAYAELPAYLSGWDVATLLFARNEATRYISPTKTPEYLAAGRPVISTSIQDVVSPYGELGLVRIADEPAEFVRAGEEILSGTLDAEDWIRRADWLLSSMSWQKTWSRMNALVQEAVLANLVLGEDEALPGRFSGTSIAPQAEG